MLTLVVLLAGQAMTVMDGSILIVASPSLQDSLHASSAELQLIVAVYTMAFAALVVAGARIGEIIGRPRAFMLGLEAFTLASLVGGLAPTVGVLILARLFQGSAAALMTPQVLSIIQTQFDGERRARAIGAYSMILAVGVAAGQILGGLFVSMHLLAAAWRPALLLNAPIGAVLLLSARRGLARAEPGVGQRLDLGGVALLSTALLALVVPLTFGRQYHWPVWVWPCLVACGIAAVGFVSRERRLRAAGRTPLLDVSLLERPGLGAGVGAIVLIMASYAGFLLTLTLYLQGALRFSPLHAGLIFSLYASGFAAASLTWTRAGAVTRSRLPTLGPVLMGAGVLAVALIADRRGWPVLTTAPLLIAAGAGHACGFAPLAHRLTSAIDRSRAADLSGLILTASLIGQVTGTAAFVSVYLSHAPDGPAHALLITAASLCAALLVTAASASRAVSGLAHAEAPAHHDLPKPFWRWKSWPRG